MKHFSVKNFERFQHYKDRSPPWIKLYNELLDDYAFSTLPDQTKFHLVAIWLLASRTENKIPHDPAWIASRINAKNRVDLDALEKAGFIIVSQDAPELPINAEQDASNALDQRQRESQRQSRAETERAGGKYAEDFELFWKAYPRLEGNPKSAAYAEWLKAMKAGVAPAIIIAAAARYAAACAKRDDPKVAHARTWLHQRRWEDWGEGAAPMPVSAVLPKTEREIWTERLAKYRPGGYWPMNAGARPESGYCDAPADLLTEWKRRTGERAA